ncbi:hypothetical protein B0T12DRAFT_347816, partial [Alternaria alternata]
ARLPVRSAIYKQCTGGLVVRWVTTSESPLLYVFLTFCCPGISRLWAEGNLTELLENSIFVETWDIKQAWWFFLVFFLNEIDR